MNDLFPEAQRIVTDAEINERYTPRAIIAWCYMKTRVHAYDLDVAACEEAHHAPRWYSRTDNGLVQPWSGHVWCNPPYSDLEPWVVRAHTEWHTPSSEVRTVSMLIPGNRTEQRFWQTYIEEHRDGRTIGGVETHFMPGRIRFGHPGNPEGINVGSPPFGCVLLVWRR